MVASKGKLRELHKPGYLFAVPPAVRYRRAAVPPLLQCRAAVPLLCPAVRCPACAVSCRRAALPPTLTVPRRLYTHT